MLVSLVSGLLRSFSAFAAFCRPVCPPDKPWTIRRSKVWSADKATRLYWGKTNPRNTTSLSLCVSEVKKHSTPPRAHTPRVSPLVTGAELFSDGDIQHNTMAHFPSTPSLFFFAGSLWAPLFPPTPTARAARLRPRTKFSITLSVWTLRLTGHKSGVGVVFVLLPPAGSAWSAEVSSRLPVSLM